MIMCPESPATRKRACKVQSRRGTSTCSLHPFPWKELENRSPQAPVLLFCTSGARTWAKKNEFYYGHKTAKFFTQQNSCTFI